MATSYSEISGWHVFTLLLMCPLHLTTHTVQMSSHLFPSEWVCNQRKEVPGCYSRVGGERDAREKHAREGWGGGDAGEME